ncbi:hypothetical protein C8T65DRAFT_662769, partial [Cerioporus squamosus]
MLCTTHLRRCEACIAVASIPRSEMKTPTRVGGQSARILAMMGRRRLRNPFSKSSASYPGLPRPR